MKGVVFTELLEMVEQQFSLAVVDEIIHRADLPSGGVYTAVGTYPAAEIVKLVGALSQVTGVPVPDLVRAFGKYLLGRFAVGHPAFFAGAKGTFALLQSVENHIHVEVKKLYPDAELPSFDCEATSDGRLVMTYRSERGLADLAHGLMVGCAEHYGEQIDIAREDLSGGAGTLVRFTLDRRAAA